MEAPNTAYRLFHVRRYDGATMALSAGARLGPYEVLAPIGAGGMGEVYRARDTRLNRDVAIKVLPEAFAKDPERLARFEREAQVLASLNHPHIAALHGLEESGSVCALVMEYVEGEDLAQRIARGAIPIDDVLPIARQIADALEAAHDVGVVHRDLKPANVKVRPDGTVKVLDFGLAKALDLQSSPLSGAALAADMSPTVFGGATVAGVILGTAAYMSPEQAAGRPVDRRADLWAFGVLMVEMLTGRQVFSGETITHVLASVLKTDPDWTTLPAGTPAPIRRLLRRCLEKDRKRRLDSAAAARLEIEEAIAGPSHETISMVVAPPAPGWRRALPWIAAVVVAMVAGSAAWLLKPSVPPAVVRLSIPLPAGQQLTRANQPALAISPDGRNVVYAAIQGEPAIQQLYLRALDSDESKPLAGTEGAFSPFFSPDGNMIGFFADGKLKKIAVTGGAAMTLADAPSPGGASWGRDGVLAVQLLQVGQKGLQRIAQDGSNVQPLTRIASGEFIQRWPSFLPGGDALLFVGSATGATWGGAHVAVEAVTGSEPSTSAAKILTKGTQPWYAPTGHLLYVQSGTLMAAPFDPGRQALTGDAVPVLENVMQFNTTGAAQYSLSATGTLVYLAGRVADVRSTLVWVSRDGREQPLPAVPQNYIFPRVSPDGRTLAVQIIDQEEQTWVYDVVGDRLRRLTFEGSVNNIPVWAPDGKRIAFSSNRTGVASNVFWTLADGSGGTERLTTSEHVNFPNSFSADGQLLAYVEVTPETGSDIWVLPMASRKPAPFLRAAHEETAPALSPDGRWMAYASNESGRREIFVMPYPGPGGKWQVSTDGGHEPRWNPRGGELFYRSGNRFMVMEVDTTSGFSTGKPRVLMEGPYLTSGGYPFYDVTADGQRFLMLKPVSQQTTMPTQIQVVLNFLEELKRVVPSR